MTDKELTVDQYVESLHSEIKRLNEKIIKLTSVIALGNEILSDSGKSQNWNNFKSFVFRFDRE